MNDNTDRSRTEALSIHEEGELRRELEEARQTLEAIRHGDIDALIVTGPKGEQVYSLAGVEHVYRVIVETMHEAALTVAPDGMILFCNRRFCALMKTALGGVIGRNVTAFVAGPQRVPLQTLLADALTGPVQRRVALLAADGSAVPVQFSVSLLQAGDSPSICLVASDLTEIEASAGSVRVLREHQQALEESEERYRRIMEAANEGIWLIDARDKTTFINEQGARLLGYTPGEMLGHSPVEYLHPADRIEGENQLNARKRGERAHLDCRMRHRNGSEVWVSSSTIPLYDGPTYAGALAMFSDISGRKQAERSLEDTHEELLARAEQLQTVNEMLRAQQQEIEAANEGLRAQDRELAAQSETLREQKERLRLALDAAHMGTWDWDLATGRVLWDDVHYRILGCRPGRVRPSYQAWAERVHPEDLPAVEAVLRRSMEKCADYTAEYRVLWPDGTAHWVEARGRFESDGAGRAVRCYGVLTDVTDRKQAEKTLRAREAQLQLIADATPVLLTRINRDLRYVFVNQACAAMLGRPPEEIVGKPVVEVLGREAFETIRPHVERVLQGERVEYETEIPYQGIEPRSMHVAYVPERDAQGQVVGWLASILDVTERKQMEKALREWNATLESKVAARTAELEKERRRIYDVLEAIPAMVCLLTPDYHVAFANRSFRQVFGEANGRHCYEFCFGRPEPCGFCETYEVLKTGRPHRWELTAADGRTIIEAHDFPFTDVDGAPLILEMSLDITARKRTETALKELNEALSHRAGQLQRLTLELSQAEERERRRIATILHEDLQQQIAGAKFHLNMMKGRADDQRLRSEAETIDEILRVTIEKSRRLSHDLSPAVVNLHDLAEVLRWLAGRMQTQHGLAVRFEIPDTMTLPSEAMAMFLFRAAQELLSNVVKHARVRETVIRVRRVRRYVCLCVSDRGQGFDPRNLVNTAGFGLLSIRERVGLLGGRMKIRSAKGQGSTFRIVVPDSGPRKGAV